MKPWSSAFDLLRTIRRGDLTFGGPQAIVLAIVGVTIAILAAMRNG